MSDDVPEDWREQLEAIVSVGWPDLFSDALMSYRAHFDDLPHLMDVNENIAARLMARAVARGRPLHPYVISRLSGGWRRRQPRDVLYRRAYELTFGS